MAQKLGMTLQTQLIEGTATIAATLTTPVDDAGITADGSGLVTIPATTTDFAVPLSTATAKYLHLEVSGGCTVKLNSAGATGIVLAPITGELGLLALAGCAVTALYITNPAGTAITARLISAQ